MSDPAPRPADSHQVGGSHYQKVPGEQHWSRLIRLFGLPAARCYFIGNITAYVERYLDKDGLKDLRKARHYLDKLIEEEEKYAIGQALAGSAGTPTKIGEWTIQLVASKTPEGPAPTPPPTPAKDDPSHDWVCEKDETDAYYCRRCHAKAGGQYARHPCPVRTQPAGGPPPEPAKEDPVITAAREALASVKPPPGMTEKEVREVSEWVFGPTPTPPPTPEAKEEGGRSHEYRNYHCRHCGVHYDEAVPGRCPGGPTPPPAFPPETPPTEDPAIPPADRSGS